MQIIKNGNEIRRCEWELCVINIFNNVKEISSQKLNKKFVKFSSQMVPVSKPNELSKVVFNSLDVI